MTREKVTGPAIGRNEITADYVRRILDYDPSTGFMTWRSRSDVTAETNTKFAGKRAGCDKGDGRVVVVIKGVHYHSYRLAWLIMTGEWPDGEIDHKDGDPANDAWGNLREATSLQNKANQRRSKANSSGYKGVSFIPETGKWRARIKGRPGAKTAHIGVYETADAAYAAYCREAKRIHGEYARLE